jgi:hypothetical protein
MDTATNLRRISPTHHAVVALVLLGLLFAMPGLATLAAPATHQIGYDLPPAGEIIVVMKDDAITAAAEDVAVKVGVKVENQYTEVFNGFSTTATQTEITKLAANPNVAFIDAVYPIQATSQVESTAISRSGTRRFSGINNGGTTAKVDIAILDTGIGGHGDLNVVERVDFTDSGTANDLDGHGTHVAGIAGAIDNGGGVVGSAPGARLHSLKVLKSSSVGTSSSLIAALDYVVRRGDIEVVNMSLAGQRTGASSCGSTQDTVHLAVCRVYNRGVLMVAAAGNNSADAGSFFPAKYPEVITVGNLADYDGHSGNDSYSSSSNYGYAVDIAAPGTQIFSTLPGNRFGYKTGTSMSAPLVAGICAMYRWLAPASAASTRYWLLTAASVPWNQWGGWSPAAPSGYPNKSLYMYPMYSSWGAASMEPTFAGAPLPIVSSESTADGSELAYDHNEATAFMASAGNDEPTSVIFDLGVESELTGIRWKSDAESDIAITTSENVEDWTDADTVTGAADPQRWQGTDSLAGATARYVKLAFSTVEGTAAEVSLIELEIWGEQPQQGTPEASPAASPVASPEASPESSPMASPAASPVASPDASPVLVVETPGATPEPVTDEPVIGIDASPVADDEVNNESAATPAPLDPTATLEPTATATVTVAPTATAEPTAAISTGVISGTDGDSVNCRLSPVDGEVIASLNEGEVVDITGDAVDGWYPVTCDGQPGYIADDFVTPGQPPAEDEPAIPVEDEVPAASPTSDVEEPSTEVAEEATQEPATEPEETPIPIVDTGDTENTNAAWLASDDDPGTYWSVYPGISPAQTRLYVDLGAVLPLDHLTLNLATWDQLPSFEIWLSEDADVWYNATPNGIDGWSLERDVDLVIDLGYDARYVRLVIPHVDQSGLSEVGGIRQLDVWAGDSDETQDLTALGHPTTPTPEPVVADEVLPTDEPTEEALPTDEPTDVVEPTAAMMPTEAPTEEEVLSTAEGEAGEQNQGGEPIDPNG